MPSPTNTRLMSTASTEWYPTCPSLERPSRAGWDSRWCMRTHAAFGSFRNGYEPLRSTAPYGHGSVWSVTEPRPEGAGGDGSTMTPIFCLLQVSAPQTDALTRLLHQQQ